MMRWMWIDKFVAFEPGVRARAVKNVSLAEDHLWDHFPGYPVMPASLMIEGVAQTGGILVGHARDFRENVILAKVQRAEFERIVRPGDQLFYDVQVERIDDTGASTRGEILLGEQCIGRVDILFSHVGRGPSVADLPEHNFVFDDQFRVLVDGNGLMGGARGA